MVVVSLCNRECRSRMKMESDNSIIITSSMRRVVGSSTLDWLARKHGTLHGQSLATISAVI